MLGSLLDRFYSTYSNRKGKLSLKVDHHVLKGGNTNINWVCFVPECCYYISFIREKIILENLNMDIYVLSNIAVQPDPELTHKYLDNILKAATKNQTNSYFNKKVNVLGISLGNVLAFKFAEHFRVNKLFSVIPGSKLAECIWESIATKEIAQNSGRNLQDYKKSLSDYNPIESVSKINPDISEIYLGMCDLMIPYKRGKELAKEMQKRFKTKLYQYRYSGHAETLFSFLKKFNKEMRVVPFSNLRY